MAIGLGQERANTLRQSPARSLAQTQAHASVILIRIMVGFVFLPEGVQKLIFPEILGSGRFTRIGIPAPELMGPFVGIVEIICGFLILLGLMTRLATIPLIITMIVAIISTKIPILIGQDFWIFKMPNFPRYGFWSMAHEIRTDMSMLLACIYLLIVGAGRWSVDALVLNPSPDGDRSPVRPGDAGPGLRPPVRQD